MFWEVFDAIGVVLMALMQLASVLISLPFHISLPRREEMLHEENAGFEAENLDSEGDEGSDNGDSVSKQTRMRQERRAEKQPIVQPAAEDQPVSVEEETGADDEGSSSGSRYQLRRRRS